MRLDQQQRTTENSAGKYLSRDEHKDLYTGQRQRLIREGDKRILVIRRADGIVERLRVFEFVSGCLV